MKESRAISTLEEIKENTAWSTYPVIFLGKLDGEDIIFGADFSTSAQSWHWLVLKVREKLSPRDRAQGHMHSSSALYTIFKSQ